MSRLDVNGQVKHMQNSMVNYPPHEDYSYTRTNDGVELINSREIRHNQQQQQQATEGSYPSPASTISPHSRDLAMSISTSSELAFALESKPTDQVSVLVFFLYHISPVLIEIFFGKQTPGSRPKSYTAYGDHHQNQLSAGAETTISNADVHGVVDRTATDHDKADFYPQQQQQETDGTQSTRVYQQETDCTALNTHGHYIPSPYSALSDAYPGSTDHHQMDYGHCVGGVGYSSSVYGETLSSVLGHGASTLNGVIQPVEPFTSYST